MKFCDSCGAKNITRAQRCSMCGAPFRITDAVATPIDKEPVGREVLVRDKPDASFQQQKIGEAASKLIAGVWAFLVAVVATINRVLFAPLGRKALNWARNSIGNALSSPENWNPKRPPNFLYWALVQFLVTKLPFAIVGIVYAVLSNAAREENDYVNATRRAERAKNWLLFDLGLWVIVTVLRNLVFN
jgi:hypothetical protein